MKASKASEAKSLTDIPNIGKAVAKDLEALGISKPAQLKGKDGLKLYHKLCKVTGSRHDPCMADTFMAAVDFMNGGKARPWWEFTKRRKKLMSKSFFFFFFFFFIMSVDAYAQVERPSLEQISSKMNKDLPEVYDPVTKLIKTTVENNNFIYNFIIDSDQKEYNWAMPKVKSQVLSNICKNQNQRMILAGHRANIVYRYENVKGQSLGQFLVPPETCKKK